MSIIKSEYVIKQKPVKLELCRYVCLFNCFCKTKNLPCIIRCDMILAAHLPCKMYLY